MNFTTDLPKSRPYVTYIVASAVKCEKFFPNSRNEGPSYRMHAVIINKSGSQSQRYKLKYRGSAHSDAQDSHSANSINSSNSTNPSFSGGDADKTNIKINIIKKEDHLLQPIKEKINKVQEKSYILCHIRKIDHNYKITKKRRSNRDPEELYDECIPKLRGSTTVKKIYSPQLQKTESYMIPKSFPKPLPIQLSKQQHQHQIQQSILAQKSQDNRAFPFPKYLDESPKNVNIFRLGDLSVNTAIKSISDSKDRDIIPMQKKMNNKMSGLIPFMNLIDDNDDDDNDNDNNDNAKSSKYNKIKEPMIKEIDLGINKNTIPMSQLKALTGTNISSASKLFVKQFHLDKLLTQELTKYENDNYDYYKIFNVLLAHKNR